MLASRAFFSLSYLLYTCIINNVSFQHTRFVDEHEIRDKMMKENT